VKNLSWGDALQVLPAALCVGYSSWSFSKSVPWACGGFGIGLAIGLLIRYIRNMEIK
jgi:hypothetical protein